MTYGENAGVIRDELTILLSYHRIQQRLGGPGNHSVPESTTMAERAEMGRIIQRYRHAALTWCRQATEAVNPKTNVHWRARRRSPEEELRYRLAQTVAAEAGGPPLMDLLGMRHDFELVTRWQHLARAAALGEHDFGAGVNRGGLWPEQSRVVAKDAADVIRGLVILDRRYDNVPGWIGLPGAASLDRAAESVAELLREEPRDCSVDAHGWRPAPVLITGPAAPGVSGAVQAQHNLLVHLAAVPNALNLRRLLHAQARISSDAAQLATQNAPELVSSFGERADVYRTLVEQSRDVGGVAGGGGPAVAESQNALTRLRHASHDDPDQAESLHEIRRLFICTDARLLATIERGFHEKLYFVPVNVPRITNQKIDGVFQARQRWMPVTSPTQTDLLPTAREQLRSTPAPRREPTGAREAREAYEAALVHRVEPRKRPTPSAF